MLTFGLIIMVNQRLNAENREAKENLERIFNTSPDAVLVTQLNDGMIVAINDGFTVITGYTSADVAGQSILSLSLWTRLSDRQKMIEELVEKGLCEEREAIFRRKNGELFSGYLSAKLISLQGVPHIISVARDITGQKQAQAALTESEGLYRKLIENAGQAIMVAQDGMVIYSNPALNRIMGYPAADIISRPFTDFIHPDDRKMVVDRYQKRMAGNTDIESVYQFRALTGKGGVRWFEINAVLIEWKGRPATLNFLTDLTDRRRAEEALRQSEERHRLLAENATDVIWTTDFEGRFTYISPSVEKLTGFRPEEMMLKSLEQTLTPASALAAGMGLADTLSAYKIGFPNRVFRGELEQICRNGSTIWTEASITGMRNAVGELIGILGVSRDITERRQSENLFRARLDLLEYAASHTIGEVLQKTLDQVCELTGSLIGFYHFVDSDQKNLSLQAWSTRTLQEFCKTEGSGMHYPIEQAGVWVDCVSTGKPVIHNDYVTLPHRKGLPEGHAAVIRELVVPILRSGKIVSILGVGNKPVDYSEKDAHLIAFFADVAWEAAERKRAEAALVQSEARYAMTLYAVNEGLWDWNVQSGHAYFSPQYYRILGYDDAEFDASYATWRTKVHPGDMDRVDEMLKSSVDTGEGFTIDLRMEMKSGRYIWVCTRGKTVERDAEGKTLRMVGTFSDITERKQSEIYHALDAAVLEILNASDDFQKSVRQILSAIRDATGCDAVGIRLQKDGDYPYYEQIGFTKEFLHTENFLACCDSDSGQGKYLECACGLVISGKTNPSHPLFTPGGSFWTNDSSALLDLPIERDPRFHPRNQCIAQGYASLALVPIRTRQKIIGLLHLGERRKKQFSPYIISIVESIASHIGESLERKQAEDALRESEEKYRSILDNISEGYFESDIRGRITFANDAGLAMMGYSPQERDGLYTAHYRQFTAHQTYEKMKAAYQQVYKTGLPSKLDDYEIIRQDGKVRTHQLSVGPLRDATGNQTGFRTVARDITDRKRTEIALRESEERFRQLAEVFPETIFEADLTGRLTYSNKHGYDTFYTTPAAIEKGINILDLVAPPDRSKAIQRIRDRSRGLTGGFLEYKALRLDGTEFDAMSYVALMTRQGKADGFRGFILDITERKRAESMILEARDKAEKASRAKSEFLSVMSHEIRTPLNAIIGMSELLEETRLSDEQKKYVHTFKNAGEALLLVINDILDYSKIEAGKIVLEREPFLLIDLLESVSEMMTLQARRNGIELNVHVHPDVPDNVLGDRQRLHQILLNLIGNAVKFTEKGEITVKLETIAERAEEGKCVVRFTVKDTGIGIPPDKLQFIFERFSQADSSITRKFGGTGLGLAICRKLIELMGGRITVESEEGKGSIFRFTLPFDVQIPDRVKPPRAESALNRIQNTQHAKISDTGTEEIPDGLPQQTESLNILHVEDAENNRMLIRAYLKKTSFRIEEAANGQIGLDKFKANRYDLVLMDMQMPVMDGYTATREIRKWEKERNLPGIPILALTAHVLKEDQEKSLAAGCTDHLTKPIKKEALMKAILTHAPGGSGTLTVTISRDLEDLIPQFMENTGKDIAAIHEALARSDWETVRRTGHSMKSYGTGYGFHSISTRGRTIEAAALQHDTPLVRQSVLELTDYLAKVKIVYDE